MNHLTIKCEYRKIHDAALISALLSTISPSKIYVMKSEEI